MKSRFQILQFAAFLLGSAALIAWAIAQGGRASTLGHWNRVAYAEVEDGKPNPIFEIKSEPPTAALALRRGSIYSEALFPPDRRSALADTQTALQLDPMLSTAWLAAARDQVYMGLDDRARVSLSRSDELNPRFPGQRLAAVRLWHILGDQKKSIQTALGIAGLDGEYRDRAATALVRCGHTPSRVYELMSGATLRGAELSRLLAAIRSPDPAEMKDLFTLLNDSQLADKDVLVSIAPLFCDPVVPSVLESLWKRYEEKLSTGHGGVLTQAPQLESAPFVNQFPLGWQKPSLELPFRASWTGQARGAISGTEEIAIEYAERGKKSSRWKFYTLLVRADVETTATTRLRVEPPGDSKLSVLLRQDGEAIAQASASATAASWQDVPLKIAPANRDRILEFVLQRDPQGSGFSTEPSRVYIDSFEVFDGDTTTTSTAGLTEVVN